MSYVLTIQERLAQLRDMVHDNLQNAQANQKQWYDRHARNRQFQPGDQVLVLLPTSTNKLLAEWRGPYPILRKVSDVNYEVKLTDGRKKKRILHVNMLRERHSPSAASFLAEAVVAEVADEADDVVLWEGTRDVTEQPLISDRLEPPQRAELDNLLQGLSTRAQPLQSDSRRIESRTHIATQSSPN